MAHSKGDWMGQNLIECDYGAWRAQFKYPVQYNKYINHFKEGLQPNVQKRIKWMASFCEPTWTTYS